MIESDLAVVFFLLSINVVIHYCLMPVCDILVYSNSEL